MSCQVTSYAPYCHPLHGYAFCWLHMYSTIPLPFYGWPAVTARPGPHSQTALTLDWDESEDNTGTVVRSPKDSCLLSEPNSPWDVCHVPSNHNWWLESTVYWEDIVVAGVEHQPTWILMKHFRLVLFSHVIVWGWPFGKLIFRVDILWEYHLTARGCSIQRICVGEVHTFPREDNYCSVLAILVQYCSMLQY